MAALSSSESAARSVTWPPPLGPLLVRPRAATASLALFQFLEVLLDHVAHGGGDLRALHVVAGGLGVLSQNVTIRPGCAAHGKRLVDQVLLRGAVAGSARDKDVFGGLDTRRGLSLAGQAGGSKPGAGAGAGRWVPQSAAARVMRSGTARVQRHGR